MKTCKETNLETFRGNHLNISFEVVGFGQLSLRVSFESFLFLCFLKSPCHDQNPTNLVYFETASPIILAALWTMCIAWTISVLLWTITIINFNPALESLLTKDDLNFTNFLINRVMGCSTKGDSHCCFRKAVSNNYFQKFLLINLSSTCSNWLKNFSSTHFTQFYRAMESISTKRVGHWSFRRVQRESLPREFY